MVLMDRSTVFPKQLIGSAVSFGFNGPLHFLPEATGRIVGLSSKVDLGLEKRKPLTALGSRRYHDRATDLKPDYRHDHHLALGAYMPQQCPIPGVVIRQGRQFRNQTTVQFKFHSYLTRIRWKVESRQRVSAFNWRTYGN